MMHFWVGIFVILATVALLFLAYQVSGFSTRLQGAQYHVVANFGNIGSLKVRAPVRIAGVRVGAVKEIVLDMDRYQAKVTIQIVEDVKLPSDSSARILTEGLLGANYIELVPGVDEQRLGDGGMIADTQSALVLENIVSKLMYK
jgi:phospholipid/cholesterol/gamma-HCH transport system substrate-binding protein